MLNFRVRGHISFHSIHFGFLFQDIEAIESNWRCGKHNLQRINCRSENSKGVYCLQYDDQKIVSGLRDNTIKMWDRQSLACQRVLTGHTGSVLCLQYDERVIISGSSDSTVRVWDVTSGEHITTLIHHCEAVLHLRYVWKFYKIIIIWLCAEGAIVTKREMFPPIVIIGGHGFWDKGGVYTGVCPKKILWPPLAAGIFFFTGVSKFFSAGGFY